jgi:murein DD-endopeptidase MepM/ murein hydrolase activator NlpD
MWSFLSDFARRTEGACTILLMDEGSVDAPQRYRVEPRRVMMLWGGSVLAVAVLAVSLVALTPVREWVPGYGTEAMRKAAKVNAVRVSALSDSLRAQEQYIRQLQGLITGRPVDGMEEAPAPGERSAASSAPDAARSAGSDDADPENTAEHGQPAIAIHQLQTQPMQMTRADAGAVPALGLQLPVRPPVEGVPTRGYDARARHYAVDIAAEEGSPVRAIGPGYVVVADWMQDGGFTIAVQHTGGYLSVYKHNQRLLKQVGDRVNDRETIALSGNTGEITTGPHLHFELWHEGLAQDPRPYIAGW